MLLGGPSIAVDPAAHVMVETNDTLALVTLDADDRSQGQGRLSGLPAHAGVAVRGRVERDRDAGRRGAYSVSVKRPWASSCGEPPWRR